MSFEFREVSSFNAADVVRVLRGELAGCIFRHAIAPDTCRQIADNFRHHPRLRRRGDGVPAYVLGAFHYRKPLAEYLDEAETFRETIHDVFEGGVNLFEEIFGAVKAALAAEQTQLRVAEYKGRQASEFVMRSWSGAGQFSLEPHEDGSQLTDRLQRGFEIQRITGPATAFNICLENPGAGELHYWDLIPDDAMRVRLGLEETGYPYPLDVVDGVPKVVVPVRAGDIYFFNGKRIHAVAAQDGVTGYRLTISGLMGFVGPSTVVYWS